MKQQLRTPVKRILDLLLYVSFCGLVGTGSLIYWRLIPGSRGGHGRSFFGMGRHDWGDVHFWLGVTFLAAIVLHLLLNWAWLKRIAASSQPWRLWAGLVAGLAIVIFFVAVPIEYRDKNPNSRDHETGEEARPGHRGGRGSGPGRGEGRGPRWQREN